MPAISKIRYTNVIYENGGKRYVDNVFQFDGYNGILLLENGGGKTVFVQTLIQAVLPHAKVAGRRIYDTLLLNNQVAHIAVEWILNEQPRRYGVTAVSLFMNSRDQVASYQFVNEYGSDDKHRIEKIPFVKEFAGQKRAAGREEIAEYYRLAAAGSMVAKFFGENETLSAYKTYLEKNLKIIPAEWEKIAIINMSEGGVEEYFSKCETTGALVDRLLIPTVEEALTGGKHDFVDLFEKQRTHFQKQIQLANRIQELERVCEDLDAYNTKLKVYDAAERKLAEQNALLRGLYDHVRVERARTDEAIEEKEREIAALQAERYAHERRKAALEVAFAEEALRAAQADREVSALKRDQAEEALSAAVHEEAQLRYAGLKESLAAQTEVAARHRAQLEALDGDGLIADVKERLEENAAQLNGYFASALHRLAQEHTALMRQKKSADEEIGDLAQKIASDENEIAKQTARRDDHSGKISQIVEFLGRIEAEILDDPVRDTVAEQAPKWRRRHEEAMEESAQFTQMIEEYTREAARCGQEITRLQAEAQSLQLQQNDHKNTVHALTAAAGALRVRLSLTPEGDIAEFYRKEARQIGVLEEETERLRKRQAEALAEERRVYRNFDDYADSAIFTADANLSFHLANWQASFSLLESGTAYFQEASRIMSVNPEETLRRYPYWAATLVTTAQEAEKAVRLLQEHSDVLGQAVIVLTEQEARDILDGAQWDGGRRVVPAKWDNVLPEKFISWQTQLKQMAQAATASKEDVERKLQATQSLLADLRTFYQEHPLHEYQELQAVGKELANRVEAVERTLFNERETAERAAQTVESFRVRQGKASDTLNDLAYRLKRAEEYAQDAERHRQLLAQNQSLNAQITDLKRLLGKKVQDKRSAEALADELKTRLSGNLYMESELKRKPFYEEVCGDEMQASPLGYDELAAERYALKEELNGRQKNRDLVEEKLQNALRQSEDCEKRIAELLEETETSLDEMREFPPNGEAEIARLRQAIRSLRRESRALAEVYAVKNDAYQSAFGAHAHGCKAYEKRYGELVIFVKALAEAAEELAAEALRLTENAKHLADQQAECQTRQVVFSEMEAALLRKNEVFHFTYDAVEAGVLAVDIVQKEPRDLREFVMGVLRNTEAAYLAMQEQERENSRQKEKFITQCQNQIYDERMKQLVISGIRNKTAYGEFLGWHAKIRENIAYSIRIAEGERKEHYTHVEQIIGQVHAYLVDVADELRQLPKKTRIKIEEGSKDFYVIHVPEWQEAAGKEMIRRHFDYITKRLEQPEFFDEFGKERPKEMRTMLEKSLKTQQLLNQLIGENAIRVKCRKVMNNRQLSIATYTWEESCRWSGGEKWSKNMALFLGCLNYLAERGKHIKMTKHCNRVVIADNPFGQASSAHVLEPVFFIAKQLGFQFIALTAHDEGGFIRKYFPVVYSLRFAQTQDQKTQIIQADKEVTTAFFQEENPAVIERMTTYEEMGLF